MNQWYLLPGMGADSSMYGRVWRSLSWIRLLDWPTFNEESSLAEMAASVIKEADIKAGDVVGGSSLGGMVALDIARKVEVAGVILIGSAIGPGELNGFLRLAAPLAAVAPIKFTQTVVGRMSDNEVVCMFERADPRFIRAMCLALPSWEGFRGPREVIHRVHGDSDLVIPAPQDAARLVAGAGHLLAITHPNECVEFVKSVRKTLTSRLRQPAGELGSRIDLRQTDPATWRTQSSPRSRVAVLRPDASTPPGAISRGRGHLSRARRRGHPPAPATSLGQAPCVPA